MVAEMFHTDGRTDMMKLIVAVSSVASAPTDDENGSLVLQKLAVSALSVSTETVLYETRRLRRSRRYNERRCIYYRGGNSKFMALKVSRYSLLEFYIIYSLSIPT